MTSRSLRPRWSSAIADVATGHGDRPLGEIVLRTIELHTSAHREPVPLHERRTFRLPVPGRWRSMRPVPPTPQHHGREQ